VTTRSLNAPAVPCMELTAGAGVQLALLAALWASAGLHPEGWVAGVLFGAIVVILLALAMRPSWPRSMGLANRITLARTTLIGGITALVADSFLHHVPIAVLVGLAAVALVLDGVDGIVARRTSTVSPLGARFDMEADAFLILVLSVFVAGSLGVWVFAIGAMRYVFVAVGWLVPWLRAPLPPNLPRKIVAATQGVVLTSVSSGIIPFAPVFVAVALALLVWSFGRDIAWLWRTRHTTRLRVYQSAERGIQSGKRWEVSRDEGSHRPRHRHHGRGYGPQPRPRRPRRDRMEPERGEGRAAS
jgi:phosphatidylglycerophosphate synthase